MMKKAVLFLMLHLLFVASVNADVIGYEAFDYANGDITGQAGGTGWDYNGTTGTHTEGTSVWSNPAGVTTVVNNTLVLEDAVPSATWICALRDFADPQANGAISSGRLYFAYTLTIDMDQAWFGIDAAIGGDEGMRFGMPWAGGALSYLGLQCPGGSAISTVLATVGQTYRIVGVVDFDNDSARMWIDPDASDYDVAPGDTSADVVFSTLGLTGSITGVRIVSALQTTWDDVIIATTFGETFPETIYEPHNSYPANGEEGLGITALTVSWDVARDPVNPDAVDPDLLSHELYMSNATDPNLMYVDSIASWDPVSLRAEYTLSSPQIPLSMDGQYFWRVKEIRTSGNRDGLIWNFKTIISVPVITVEPSFQIVDTTATANFTITATSISEESYQWYKYVDGVSDTMLNNGGDISGATTSSLSIANAELADEGLYYCIVTNIAVLTRAVMRCWRSNAYWLTGILNRAVLTVSLQAARLRSPSEIPVLLWAAV